MDCERLLLAMKKWGYRGVSYSYLTKLLGLTPEEAEKCGKKVGIDLGYGVLFLLQDET